MMVFYKKQRNWNKVTSVNQSEIKAAEFIGNVFRRSFEHVRVLTGVVLPLPEGSTIATAEFDCIVVCESGIYLFEIKGWNHCQIVREKVEDKNYWHLVQTDGRAVKVSDPVYQGVQKLMALKTYIGSKVLIKSFVFTPGMDVHHSPKMPTSVLTAQDLPYAIRVCRANFKKSKNVVPLDQETVGIVVALIEEMSEGHTLDAHIANCEARGVIKKEKMKAKLEAEKQSELACTLAAVSPAVKELFEDFSEATHWQ